MVSLLTMTGGASLAGAWVYKRWEAKKQQRQRTDAGQSIEQSWSATSWQTVQACLQQIYQRFAQRNHIAPMPPMVDAPPLAFTEQTADVNAAVPYELRTATLALGVTTAGWLFFPPLQLAGLPLLVYMGIPAAQAAYDQLWVDGRPSRALAETVALAACLAGDYYWAGALGFWLYYGGRQLLAEQQQGKAEPRLAELAPTTTHRWQAGAACVVPTAALQPGDHVLVYSSELVPVDGLITEGVAWLRRQALSSAACDLHKTVGDKVAATDLVLVGRICIRVLPAA